MIHFLKIISPIAIFFIISNSASAKTLQFSAVVQCGVATPENDTACAVNPADAANYCKSYGDHLPSAREFAEFAKMHGALGVVESCDHDKDCRHVNVVNADGKHDEFYYSSKGYIAPEGDLGDWGLWSSSQEILQKASVPYPDFFGGTSGNMDTDVWGNSMQNAVTCVLDN